MTCPRISMKHFLLLVSTLFVACNAQTERVQKYLEGIGYREQSLQQPKTFHFRSNEPKGIQDASFGGGTNIFIKSAWLNHIPEKNFIYFRNKQEPFKDIQVMGRPLDQDDSFNSNPKLGFIVYRVPAPHDIYGVSADQMGTLDHLTLYLEVKTTNEMGQLEHLKCNEDWYCRIEFKRSRTPEVFHIQPQVIFYEGITQVVFEPNQVDKTVKNLLSDEMPFVNTEIGGSKLDFEFFVDYQTSYQWAYKNFFTGKVGDMPIGYTDKDIKMLWEVGWAIVSQSEATTCTYDMSKCYQAMTVPVIFNISAHTGNTNGRQNLTIFGHGFNSPDVKVKVAGVDCRVTQYYDDSVSCQVGLAESPTKPNIPYAGSHGIRREFYNSTNLRKNNFEVQGVYSEHLLTQFEVPSNQGDYTGNILKGWFVAPATTRYRFHIACDDVCDFQIGLNPEDPLKLNKLITLDGYKAHREFFMNGNEGETFSEWVELSKDEKYYVQGFHLNYNWDAHYTVGVEIEQSDVKDHHHSMKEIQYIEVSPKDPKYDTSRLTVKGKKGQGSFYLIFQDKDNNKHISGRISVGEGAWRLQGILEQSYYWDKYYSYLDVNRTMYTADDVETKEENLAEKFVYYIRLKKLINEQSVSNIQISKSEGTDAEITVDLPETVQLSSTPLKGKFRVTCPSPNNDVVQNPLLSGPMHLAQYAYSFKNKIALSCEGTRDKIEVQRIYKDLYSQNGFGYYLRFNGIPGNIPQMRIVSDEDDPLQGDYEIKSSKIIEASSNIFYKSIPFEMLRTFEQNPQVEVHVGEFPAVCKNLSCDFNYVDPIGEITSYKYSEQTYELQLTGVDLPAEIQKIDYIEFAQTRCSISKVSATGISCKLDQTPVCGEFFPILVTRDGMISNSKELTPFQISCTAESLKYQFDLNVLGGDNITIQGTFLPHDLGISDVVITFTDEQATKCVPMISTSTYLVCQTESFDEAVSKGKSYGLKIFINGGLVENSISVTLKDTTGSGITINPTSANPTLKTQIEIKLPQDFPFTLVKSDFSVNATSTKDPDNFRQMNVIKVDDASKTLTCIFGGAWSGLYRIDIRHQEFGRMQTKDLILNVGTTVKSYEPKQGSIYGGTLLTITGTNFGKEKTDNPVQISTLGAAGSVDCFLQTITETQIVCRIGRTSQEDAKKGTMIVFLKTSEEATCDPKETCEWTYTAKVPTVTSINTIWDSENYQWTIEVEGSDFSGTPDSTELFVNGKVQKTLSLTDSKVVFKITDISGSVVDNINLYFDVGIPKGHDQVIDGKSFKLEPKLVSFSPNMGSPGGTLIKVKFEGIGPSTDSKPVANLRNYFNGQEMCRSFKVVSYGEGECLTNQQEIDKNFKIGLYALDTKLKSECSNSDPELCQYTQQNSESFPVVESVDNSDFKSIVFSGTSFYTEGYTGYAKFAGVQASSVTLDSKTSATASWSLGLPPSNIEEEPLLWFKEEATGNIFYAKSTSKIAKPLKVTGSSTGLKCSFAGGCNLEINAEGLSSMLKSDPENNYISVCDDTCEFIEDLSDSSKAVCKLPKISTVYSNKNFKIEVENEDLRFRKTFGTMEDFEKAFDNQLIVTPDKGTEQQCVVGGSFKENHVGLLSQVKYFMGDIRDKDVYSDKLKFQGSADGQNWKDLFTVDENIHEGWNSFTWETAAQQPKYRFYRFVSEDNRNGCNINEIKMIGVETIDNSNSQYSCKVTVQQNDVTLSTLDNQVTFDGSLTSKLESINPRFGPVTGGTQVTFSGVNFDTDKNKYTILIDGRKCQVDSASSTSVICTTDHRPGLVEPSLEIKIEGKGHVANQQNLFRYVSYWSDDTTWGGEFAPMYMESVYIPKGLNLFVDVDKTPELNLIVVEGALLFAPDPDPNHERFFDARYIMVRNGYVEVGTEEFPYTSQLTITMHGNRTTPFIPIFGNKCIGVDHGVIDMHGVKRTPTWTVLNETALPGATQIKLTGPVDWVEGEQIAIAATGFNGREAEKRVIKAIDKSNPNIPVVTLDQQLDYKHFSMIQKYGDDFIDTRAEVGLLTRNVKFRGDPETSFDNQYGAAIFLHSEGDDSLIARLEFIELTDVGQAFLVGRYAVHFHMIGALHKSYCKGFGTHQGFNRAFTLHGAHYLRLMENVVFNVKGHNIFIEDAVERKNYIYKNLVINAKRSWSLLNTDQTPACFWITNPDNNFIENHCAGSDRYGYWYDLQQHAMGPHANTDVCPENERVGEFRDNHAHSCGRYGFRIFHNMVPRKYPCKKIIYDKYNKEDPYWQNPPITANFYRLTSWKNMRNGAIAERVGDVRFHDFKVADNILGGIEFSLTDEYGDDTTRINGGLVIGRTQNTEPDLELASPFGIIGPRTENFRVDGVKFFNFDWNEAAALSSCSHCFHPAATDSGARTVKFSKLSFDKQSVKRLINFQKPWRAIFLDEDGSLTGKGPNSWATPYWEHHNQPECERNEEYYGGVFCTSEIQVRRVAFHEAKPSANFRAQGFKVLRYDDEILAKYDDLKEYLDNQENYATLPFKKSGDPSMGWAIPFITGHKYKIHFGKTGIDYEKLTIDASERWEPSDKSIYLVHNWTDVREAITFKEQKSGNMIPNNSIAADQKDWEFGQNVVYNDTETRETHFIINGKGYTDPYEEQRLVSEGYRCVESCNERIDAVEIEDRVRRWSTPSDWPSGKVPAEREDVHIEPGWNMVFDMNPSPVYQLIRVNGILTFDDSRDTHLNCKHLFIRTGELHIGSEEKPMQKKARITLHGEKSMENIVYDNAVEAGNKLIANANIMRIYGKPRSWKMTRLANPALKGSDTFDVEAGLELFAGDRIALLPTSYDGHTIDEVIVKSYDKGSGKVTANSKLNYYHWGQQTSTADDYDGLDMRGEVILLTRNVKIDAEDIGSWGGQIVTSDVTEVYGGEMIQRQGSTIMDNVEIYNCSQIDTLKAALRFESATGLYSQITNSAIHNGYAWGLRIKSSANILIKNNVFFNFRPIGVGVLGSKNITIDDNVVGGIVKRETLEASDQLIDKEGAFSICAYFEPDTACKDIFVRNNIAAGSVYGGFMMMGHKCDDYSSRFEGNVAHSVKGSVDSGVGLFFKNAPGETDCVEFSNFKAYKCFEQGAFSYADSKRIQMSKMTLVDNKEGSGAIIKNKLFEYKDDRVNIKYKDMKFYGEYGSPDCPQDGEGGFCVRIKKYGFMSSFGTHFQKKYHIDEAQDLPPDRQMSDGSWMTRVELHNTHFIGFKAKTEMGERQRGIQIGKFASDNIPIHEFYDTTFDRVEEDALAWLMDPPQDWATIDDCGNFPCSGPLNTAFSFKKNTFIGDTLTFGADNFQLIPNTPGFSEFVPNCVKKPYMNAWTCQQEKIGQILFESEDSDKMDRAMQPIFSKLAGTEMSNKINAHMDHLWDGFYTSQKRMSRFPVLVFVPKGAVYDIMPSGNPPKKMKFTLISQDKTIGMTVRIAYPGDESRQIIKDGKRVDMNQWDDQTNMYGEVKQTECGENRFIGVKNILEFYLTEGCVLQIAPRNAIQTMVRLEWTLEEFKGNGGTTAFIDRVAGSLGIHASTIKIVSVYEGSLVVNYNIVADDNDVNPEDTLVKLNEKQTQQFATGQIDLGAPILDVQSSVVKESDTASADETPEAVSIVKDGVVTAPGYEQIDLNNLDQDEPEDKTAMVFTIVGVSVLVILLGGLGTYYLYMKLKLQRSDIHKTEMPNEKENIDDTIEDNKKDKSNRFTKIQQSSFTHLEQSNDKITIEIESKDRLGVKNMILNKNKETPNNNNQEANDPSIKKDVRASDVSARKLLMPTGEKWVKPRGTSPRGSPRI